MVCGVYRYVNVLPVNRLSHPFLCQPITIKINYFQIVIQENGGERKKKKVVVAVTNWAFDFTFESLTHSNPNIIEAIWLYCLLKPNRNLANQLENRPETHKLSHRNISKMLSLFFRF